MRDSERIRGLLGISRAEFSRRYHIPVRTLESWDKGVNIPPNYVIELLERAVREDRLEELQKAKNHLQMEIEKLSNK